MEHYPEELRTPPVMLVSLVGCPDLHPAVTSFLHSENPPMNTLALPEFSKISVLSGKKQKDGNDIGATSTGGILKRDWISKHRTKVPSVVAVFFAMDRVAGNPAQWQQVCTDLDNLKIAIHSRNIKLIVVLVQTSTTDDISEDLMTLLKKRAEIDGKFFVVFGQKDESDIRKSCNRLCGVFSELSNMYYREQVRRIKGRIEKKNISCFELNIRYCFKVGIFCEFIRDWLEALKLYQDGYHTLHEVIKDSKRLPPIQHLVEIKAVAEQFNFKVSTLLLHGGKVAEAIVWFRKHVTTYGQLVGASEVGFLHWEWMSRQYLVFAELLETSSASAPGSVSCFGTPDNPLTEWEYQPAYYYQLSASYLRERKNGLSKSLLASGFSDVADAMDDSLDSVIPSVYVGQFVRLLEQGTVISMLPLNDAEYGCYALSEGKKVQDMFEITALFRRSVESFSSLKASRMSSYCSSRVAKEYFASREFVNSKQLFIGVADLYRQEGWVTLLWESLGYIRECSRELGLLSEFIEFSLEMASLPAFSFTGMDIPKNSLEYGPGGAPSLSRRQIIQEEAFMLLKENSGPGDGHSILSLAEGQSIYLEIDPVSPLRTALLASIFFHEQSIKPGSSTSITLALLSQLPCPLEIDRLEVQFNQPECNFTISNAQKKLSALTLEQQGSREEIAPTLTLETNTWMRLTYNIKSEQSGKLECLSVTSKLGPHLTICCRAECPASMEGLPLWKFEDLVETFPSKDPELSFSGQKIIQIQEPEPQIEVSLNASGPALVGEIFTVPILIKSIGHEVNCGELKINIVDARGGGLMSLREIEEPSHNSLDVELLSVSGISDEEDSPRDVENIKKITHSFGVVPVPSLEGWQSWSGKLTIKWHRPKQVMVYVSLRYSPNRMVTAPHKVSVHKSLQIEGKIPLVINHSFMLPFRRDPLMISMTKPEDESGQMVSLSLNETTILIISARNSCEVPLRLVSVCIELGGDASVSICSVHRIGGNFPEHPLLVPGEEFKAIFSVIPHVESQKLGVGSIHLKWERDSNSLMFGKDTDSCVSIEQKLPDIQVELPSLIVTLDCPPHAVLGEPFTVFVKVQNLTSILQEVKYSVGDSQIFVFSGSHNNATFILPKSEHVVAYKLVPLNSGHQQIPRFTVTSIRYSAGYHSSVSASTIFIFPSEPHLNHDGSSTGLELSAPLSST